MHCYRTKGTPPILQLKFSYPGGVQCFWRLVFCCFDFDLFIIIFICLLCPLTSLKCYTWLEYHFKLPNNIYVK